MAYDQHVADRLRELLASEPDVTEKAMFGGLAFLIDGHLTVAASGRGGVLLRADPDDADLLQHPSASPFEMRGRELRGWLHVVAADDELAGWVARGVAFVRTLPADGLRRTR